MKTKYVELDDFLAISNIKNSTFLKRYKDIPGVTFVDGCFKIIEGTRFPFNIGHNKLKTTEDRRYVLLKAIDEKKYIDHIMLRLYQPEFEELLKDLLKIGLIEDNNMSNTYGANKYSATNSGSKYLKESRRETIRFITELLAQCSAKFVSEVVSN